MASLWTCSFRLALYNVIDRSSGKTYVGLLVVGGLVNLVTKGVLGSGGTAERC